MDEGTTPEAPRGRRGPVRRFLPLLVLLAAAVAVWASGLTDWLDFARLRDNLDTLRAFVAGNRAVALLLLVAIYGAGTAMSLPAMSLLTVFSGVVFGLWAGFVGVWIGAVLGATAIFLVVRTSLGDALRRKAGPWLRKLEEGFAKDEFNYLFALRLVPVFPFWVLNIAPALLGMKLRNYVLATALGIVPGTFVYVWVGKGAAETIRLGGEVNPAELLFQVHILGPILGLALLALVPVFVRRVLGSRIPGAEPKDEGRS